MTPRVGQHAYSSALEAGTSSATISYLLYLPQGYGSGRAGRWPLILFLHGMGERGSDLEALKRHPLPEMLETRGDFPFIVVSPQLTDDCYAWDGRIELLDALITEVQGKYSVDPRRIYLTGLSPCSPGSLRGNRSRRRLLPLPESGGAARHRPAQGPADLGLPGGEGHERPAVPGRGPRGSPQGPRERRAVHGVRGCRPRGHLAEGVRGPGALPVAGRAVVAVGGASPLPGAAARARIVGTASPAHHAGMHRS
jgi:hypothetical protein